MPGFGDRHPPVSAIAIRRFRRSGWSEFRIVTPRGTIPITLGIQLQRAGKSAASKSTPAFVRAIASFLRG